MPNPRFKAQDDEAFTRYDKTLAVKRWLATRFSGDLGDNVADIDRLVDLLDVLLTNPQDGDKLTYDSSISKWKNESGGSLTPPVTLEGVNPINPILTIDGNTQSVEAFKVIDTNGALSFESGGPNGNRMTGSNPIGTVLHMTTPVGQTAPAITIVDTDGNDCFTVGGVNGVTLSADAVSGNTELQITTFSLIYRDENGDPMLDIEGGYVNLGPGGEVAVTAGAVFLTLPTADPHVAGQIWNSSGVLHISAG